MADKSSIFTRMAKVKYYYDSDTLSYRRIEKSKGFLTRVVLAEDKVAAASAVEACATWSQFTTLLREKLVVQWQLLLSSKTGHAWLKLVLRVDGHVVILDGNVKQGVFNAQNGELFHGCECV